jgi:hypothetical protein
MQYGVGVARKAGATPDYVLNTLKTDALERYFQDRRS